MVYPDQALYYVFIPEKAPRTAMKKQKCADVSGNLSGIPFSANTFSDSLKMPVTT